MKLWPGPLSIRTRLTLWYASLLLVILLVVSGLSYALLRRSLLKDVDTELQIIAHVVGDTWSAPSGGPRARSEVVIQELLGLQFYDNFFQLVDPDGRPIVGSGYLRGRSLTVSETARRNAAEGRSTFETVPLAGDPARVLTMPIVRDGRLVQFVQAGTTLQDTEQTLLRYLETLLVLIPVGLALATAGGAAIARAALRPITEVSRTARRITAEDLSRRIPARLTGDEVDDLVETLNAMLSRLDDAFTLMRRFAADAAHELRTPLAVLKGGMEVALRAPRSAEEYRRVLQSSLEEVERLIRLAEDLLLLSRLSADPGIGTRPAQQPVDLEPIVLEVLDAGSQLAQSTGVSVRLSDCAPAIVVGEAADLRRALLNLVENAVKYTPPGGKAALALTTLDGWAAFAIRDNGPGIAAADAERVFQPFVRLDAARGRATGGAGLGLAIARSIALAHGGSLTLESAPGAGSLFTMRLPLATGGLAGGGPAPARPPLADVRVG